MGRNINKLAESCVLYVSTKVLAILSLIVSRATVTKFMVKCCIQCLIPSGTLVV